jgi:hypothetical protein
MGKALGDSLVTDCPVRSIDLATRIVNDCWQAEKIISTIPWTLWPGVCDIPAEIAKAINQLNAVAVDVDYVPETMNNPSHWIYEPDETIPHHRYLLRSNFCTNARGYWTETNTVRSRPTTGFRHHNEFAYPLNTLGKPEAVAGVLAWAEGQGVLGVGRGGKWDHMNSDIAVAEAMGEAARITSEITSK